MNEYHLHYAFAMEPSQTTSACIQGINLAYLQLVQRLLRADKSAGMARLGLSENVGTILEALTPYQISRIASTTHLLCVFSFNDHAMLSALVAKERLAASKGNSLPP